MIWQFYSLPFFKRIFSNPWMGDSNNIQITKAKEKVKTIWDNDCLPCNHKINNYTFQVLPQYHLVFAHVNPLSNRAGTVDFNKSVG